MNILVCFDNNDCLVTRINCTFEEAKEYYIDNDFSYWSALYNKEKSREAKFVLDTEKSFLRTYRDQISEDDIYIFDSLELGEFVGNSTYINIKRVDDGETITVEPQWFFANDNRRIFQD